MTNYKKLPRGLRNNNPLNIRRGATKWQGEVNQVTRIEDSNGENVVTCYYDRSFCQFKDISYGWRAAFILLKKYINVYGLNTIEKIISRWAPSNENNTKAYIAHVALSARIPAIYQLHFNDADTMLRIAVAMCEVENGVTSVNVDNQQLILGYNMAATYSMYNVVKAN